MRGADAGGPADAAAFPVSDIVGSGAGAHFSPASLAADDAPPQCPGYHAGFGVVNETLSPQVIQYYGGRVTIDSGAGYAFRIGGTADHYLVDYLLAGTTSQLQVLVP